jgi:hypothetical protein
VQDIAPIDSAHPALAVCPPWEQTDQLFSKDE